MASGCRLFSIVYLLCLQVSTALGQRISSQKLESTSVTIAQIDKTNVEIRFHHRFGKHLDAKWLAGTYLLPDEIYPQTVTSNTVSIRLPLEQVKTQGPFPGPFVTLTLSFGQDQYGFEFDIMSALNAKNKTFETSTTYGEIREDLKVYPLDVEPNDNILYTPGEVFDIEFKLKDQTTIIYSSLSFISVSPNTEMSVVNSIDIPFNLRDLQASKGIFSFPEPKKPTLRVNTSSLTTGGMFISFFLYKAEVVSVRHYITYKMITLNLKDTNAPIPPGRVAILSKPYAQQSIIANTKKSQLSCIAVGNPPPKVEIRIGGQSVESLKAKWEYYGVGTMVTTYNIPTKELIDGPVTCYAENQEDSAEMAINIKHESTPTPEPSKSRRLGCDMMFIIVAVAMIIHLQF